MHPDGEVSTLRLLCSSEAHPEQVGTKINVGPGKLHRFTLSVSVPPVADVKDERAKAIVSQTNVGTVPKATFGGNF